MMTRTVVITCDCDEQPCENITERAYALGENDASVAMSKGNREPVVIDETRTAYIYAALKHVTTCDLDCECDPCQDVYGSYQDGYNDTLSFR